MASVFLLVFKTVDGIYCMVGNYCIKKGVKVKDDPRTLTILMVLLAPGEDSKY